MAQLKADCDANGILEDVIKIVTDTGNNQKNRRELRLLEETQRCRSSRDANRIE
jgi:hypothetical protein